MLGILTSQVVMNSLLSLSDSLQTKCLSDNIFLEQFKGLSFVFIQCHRRTFGGDLHWRPVWVSEDLWI